MVYLLDTNVCVHILKNHSAVIARFVEVGYEPCAISEITAAELKFGDENSPNPAKQRPATERLLALLKVLPIGPALDKYAQEKVRLSKIGKPLNDEFDLLIGATALVHDLTMVTNNTKHFIRFAGMRLEDWSSAVPPEKASLSIV